VAVEKMRQGNGSISIVGRYTQQKTMQSDYTFEMSWNAPRGKVIGTGMSGPVRLATGKDGREYAVKSFKKKQLNPKARAELQSEVEIYLSLDHPHIARLEQVYETDEEIHLVMEYLAGGELYERLTRRKMYTEQEATDTVHQMLLAVAYLHSRSIIHRDLKLENFLYEGGDSDHLKLIDFGFAKIFTGSTKLSDTCGSIHYVAPEVLKKSYTSQADMWSLGVISHMLLTGSPVFRGSDLEIISLVRRGKTRLSSRFGDLSTVAQNFVQALLVLDPSKRLTAKDALQHPFLAHRNSIATSVDVEILHSLQNYAQASRFRRVCLSMMAWSLSMEDRQRLRGKFLELDVHKKGTISLPQFKAVLQESYHVNSAEAERLFAALDTDHDNEICYSEFLAAVLQDRVRMHEHVLRRTFARFDRDEAGVITVENLRTVLGDTFEDVDVMELMREADTTGSGFICYEQFLQYLQEQDSDRSQETSEKSCWDRSRSPTAQQREKHCNLAGGLMDVSTAELDAVEQRPLTPLTQKSVLSPSKMDRGLFHSSLMRAATEAAISCVRLPK